MAKMCIRVEILEDGVTLGKLLDFSLVDDDHFFGISEDGKEMHMPSNGIVKAGDGWQPLS